MPNNKCEAIWGRTDNEYPGSKPQFQVTLSRETYSRLGHREWGAKTLGLSISNKKGSGRKKHRGSS